MLDGILGRGFSVKCKSLIKTTRARIEVVRKRAEAKQRFLREDLAKLLSNGLDINAYGRTEEFVAGVNLLFCYDFVEQCCEHTAKQLSRMQKQGECPEECREAVACLMYAAARFSGLPELRELRDIFEQRYGNCLESAVNQKFVEKLSSSPPTSEKRLRVLQDIALDFSIKWDSSGFERKLAAPSAVAQEVAMQKADAVKRGPGIVEERKSRIREGGEDDIISRRDEAHHSFGLTKSYPIEKSDSEPKVEKSTIGKHGKIFDYSNGIGYPSKGESEREALFREKSELAPSHLQPPGRTENGISCYARPPPYVKSKDKNIPRPPYIKPNEDKHRAGEEDKHGNGRVYKHDQITDHGKETGRKKQHRLRYGFSFEELGGGAMSSRRKEHSRKGLQILFDEGPHMKGDEERMIDTLLMQFSKTSLIHEDDASLRKLMTDFGESSARKKS